VALQFLKGYYKYRPRGEGETIARLDMMAPGGIMADGHLTFKKEDGSPFLATFEATANDTIEEVVFRQQPVLRNMDALAAASVVGALVLGFLFAEDWKYFAIIGKYWAVLIGLCVGVGCFYLIHYLIRGLRRYRYIYAIEQFRQYYADQQWVALAEDVFTDPNDKYYKELKDQCIKQGFGLLVIGRNEKAHLVITPARVQTLKKRRLLRFEEAQDWTRRMTERIRPGKPIVIPQFMKWTNSFQWPAWLKKWVRRVELPDFSLSRYQRSYFNQILITVASIAASAAMLYDLYKIPPVRYAEDEYVKELEILTQTTRRETGEYLVDTPFLWQFTKVPKSVNPMADEPSPAVKPKADTVAAAPEIPIPGMEPPPPPPKPGHERAKPSAIDAYDCDRFYGIKGSRYLVLYGALVDEEALARRKLDTIYNAGIEGGMVWMGCFETRSGAFAVYLGTFFNTPEEAASQKTKFEIILQEEGIKSPSLKLRPLVFKSGD